MLSVMHPSFQEPLMYFINLLAGTRILRELAEVLTKTLSIIYQQPCASGEVPADWKQKKNKGSSSSRE